MSTSIPTAAQVWRVVIADDSPDDRAETRRLLLKGSDRRYKFIETETGAAAVRLVRADPPDCVVLDYHLPDMEATEILAALADPNGLPACPVVVVTGSAELDFGRSVLRAGAQDYIGKDWLTPEGLTRTVENAAERWAMARELQSQAATLRETEERLRLAQQAARAGTWELELDTQRFAAGDEALALHGIAPGTPMTHAAALAAIHPDDQPQVDAALARARDAGEPFRVEYRALQPDGSVRWLLSQANVRHGLGAGRLVGLVQDITDRKRAEEEVREQEARLRLALEASGTGIWTWDFATDAVRWSPECYEIHGVPAGGLDGTAAGFDRLVHPDDRARVWATIRAAADRGTTYECEFRIVRPGGEVRWVANRGRANDDARGRPVRMLGTITDITARREVDERIRGNHDTFFSLIENAPFGLYVVDADFRLRQVSAGAQRAFASVPPPLLGRDFAEVIQVLWPDPFASSVIARFRHTLATGEPYASPRTVERRADTAEEEAYDWRIERVTLPDGRFGVVCYFYDLSERNRLEAAVRQSESFYRQTLESIPGMVFTNTPDGACDYVSEQWVAFTGIPAAEQLGSGWVQVLHPDDRDRAFAAWRAAVEGRGEYDLEYRVRRADGGYEWFKVRGRAIRDGAGATARWFGTAVNIDGLKQAEARLVTRERELQTLADNTPDILSRFDRELRHVFVNTAIEKATGRSRLEFLGKTNAELGMPADLCRRWEAAIRAVFASGSPHSLEFDFPTPEGLRHYAARLVPERGASGAVEFVLGVTHDVTERKRFEQTLADQDKRKDEFLATLAHELRNPLAPLSNGLEILRMAPNTGPAVKRAQDMMGRQLRHLVNLVDDLLDISRVSQGKITLKRERLTAREVIEAAIEACRPMVDTKQHTLAVDVPAEPIALDADRTRLVQVVSNLLTNAAKYSEPGGRIAVTAWRDGADAVIAVTDTGVGIAPEVLPTLWDMFTQVRDTLDKAQGGLGIGLSLVKKLVAMHGGTVAAQSKGLGFGSTFTVRLPLATADRPPAPGSGPANSSVADQAVTRRILVVDDNVDGAASLSMMLGLFGHRTETAHDGTAALAVARTFRPEVVFLDIGLPGLDGYEVARRLRADPVTASTILVALSGWGSEDDKRKSQAAGFDLHLTKPVELDALQGVLAWFNPRSGSTPGSSTRA